MKLHKMDEAEKYIAWEPDTFVWNIFNIHLYFMPRIFSVKPVVVRIIFPVDFRFHEKKMRGMTLAPVPCGSCHATEFDAKFSSDHQASLPPETCTYCHHAELGKLLYSHEDHAAQHDCTECHHGPDIEAEPGAYNQCHGAKAEEKVADRKSVV